MKLTFNRESHQETMEYKYHAKPLIWQDSKPQQGWSGDGFTVVHIGNLINRGSDFRVVLEAEDGELETWLERYATTHPKEAISLLAQMLQLAVSKLE